MNATSIVGTRHPLGTTAFVLLAIGLAANAGAAPASGDAEVDGFRADPDSHLTSWGSNAGAQPLESELESGFQAALFPELGNGLQPDEQDGPVPGRQGEAVAAWSGFRYVFVAGSAFYPRTSATGWAYAGSGCTSAVADAFDVFNVHLHLPSGVRIDYLRLFYYDSGASDSQSWITTYDGAGALVDITTTSSTGTAGYGTTLSPLVEHVVNTTDSAYVLNWRSMQTGPTMRLCGMRVAYREPQ